MSKKDSQIKFDYIIIGAGTSGATLAKLLTDDGKTSVLLLEAGTDLRDEESDPSFFGSFLLSGQNKFSYQLFTGFESPTATVDGITISITKQF